jgi:hypothetical protein
MVSFDHPSSTREARVASRIAESVSALRGRPVRPVRGVPGWVLLDMPATIPAGKEKGGCEAAHRKMLHTAGPTQIRYDP